MLLTRFIPALLVDNQRLVKGVKFKDHRYVGDPMNAIRIFSEKEVDELMLLDITATERNSTISEDLVRRISSECLMPITVGGGVRTLAQAKALLNAGAEKISLGTSAHDTPQLIREIADTFGSQAVVASVDVGKNWRGQQKVYSRCGKSKTAHDPVTFARKMEQWGVGEILLNSIDQDGTMEGFDTELIKSVSEAVSIPVIALGGAGKLEHFRDAIKVGKASAVAAGSYFVFHGKLRAVLINYPSRPEIDAALV